MDIFKLVQESFISLLKLESRESQEKCQWISGGFGFISGKQNFKKIVAARLAYGKYIHIKGGQGLINGGRILKGQMVIGFLKTRS